jgi:hypothetical protein
MRDSLSATVPTALRFSRIACVTRLVRAGTAAVIGSVVRELKFNCNAELAERSTDFGH